jgi:rhomboid protease GluP
VVLRTEMLVYNAPVVLTFAILSTIVLFFDTLLGGWLTRAAFSSRGIFNPFSPLDYAGLFTHILGHANWTHLSGNFVIILLVGPMLEEKYGSQRLLSMILVTAIATGITSALLLSTGIMGASGIAFMMLMLASFVNVRQGQIPITFLLAAGLFLGQEFFNSFRADNISQFAHILGGCCGGLFGMYYLPRQGSSSVFTKY